MAPRSRTIALLAAACLLTFACLALQQVRRRSAVWDECFHLTAGYAALTRGDYRFSQAHAPFQRLWNALPLLAMDGIRFAPDLPSARQSPTEQAWAFQFTYPPRFLFQDNNVERLLPPARMMSVLLGLLLGFLLYRWARRLYGAVPALAALLLLCLEPNILSHSCFVTTDISVTCFMLGTIFCLWRVSRAVTWGGLAGLAAFFGLAQASKFTALLLGPIVLLLLLARAFNKVPWPVALGAPRELHTRRAKLTCAAALTTLLVVAAAGAIWAAYGFRHDPHPVGSARLEINPPAVPHSPVTAAAAWARDCGLIPRAYADGFIGTGQDLSPWSFFLAGETSKTGWWFYFPVAFLVKTPLSTLLLAGAGLVILLRRHDLFMRDGVFILVPVVVFMAVMMTSGYNIGVRHILPVTPFVVLLGAAPFAVPLPRLWRGATLLLLAVAVAETAVAQPHPLGFFNLLAGGPHNGYKILVDSNVDWGQDLKEVRDWQAGAAARYPGLPLFLSYFGTAPPEAYGVRARTLPGYGHYQLTRESTSAPLRAGVYGISVTMLQGVYSPFPGRWCVPYENQYQETLSLVGPLEDAAGDTPAGEGIRGGHRRDHWEAELVRLQDLRFARLCAALRNREPDERIGSSFLIYALTDQDIKNALLGAPAELAPAVQVRGAVAPSAP